MTTSTRIIYADVPEELLPICRTAGYIRADIWRRYGGLKTAGKSANDPRKEITELRLYDSLPIDGTIRGETTKDIIHDVFLYRAAAQQKVRKAIFAKAKGDQDELKRLYALLRYGDWTTEPFLHHQMRKHFKHGKSQVDNQFVVRSDKFRVEMVDDKLVVVIHVASKYGKPIRLTTTTSGKNVHLIGKNLRIILIGKNLRIIVRNNQTEIHYSFDKTKNRPCGQAVIGIDKGYTEAFVDSDGQAHGKGFGKVMSEYGDKTHQTGQSRNKLYALEKKHRQAGRISKADRIKNNNLGNKKINGRKERAHQRLRDIAFKAAHSIVDKAEVVAAEDLTGPIPKTHPWKKYNRKMTSWAKGVLAEALESTAKQRNANLVLVNAAYISQMDSNTHLLEGKRVGDKFYRANGDVLQADFNAARNVRHRLDDHEITLYTPYKEVRRILLSRSTGATERHRHELQEASALVNRVRNNSKTQCAVLHRV